MGSKVCDVTLYFLNMAHMDGLINATNIALISKGNNLTSVSEFRPISLCDVIYKIIAKVLTNRLKVVLSNVMSPFQSAFFAGRLITDRQYYCGIRDPPYNAHKNVE
jgi:hypothetical protein